jgi:hypothetical protein
MTLLKWLVGLVSLGYLGGLTALFLLQRSFLFPIPQTARTAPAAADRNARQFIGAATGR